MKCIIDHLVVMSTTLDEGVTFIEDKFGIKMGPGGQHLEFGTHNRLINISNPEQGFSNTVSMYVMCLC